MRRGALYLGLALTVLGCDHATKLGAEIHLSTGAPISVVSGVLDLQLAHNHDMGFGLMRALPVGPRRWVLLGTGVLLMLGVGVTWYARRRRASALELSAYALLVGGGLGNLIDRAARGYVVDFVHLAHWPIFNVADVALLLGVAALLWQANAREGPWVARSAAP
jgi:signal peptidase II